MDYVVKNGISQGKLRRDYASTTLQTGKNSIPKITRNPPTRKIGTERVRTDSTQAHQQPEKDTCAQETDAGASSPTTDSSVPRNLTGFPEQLPDVLLHAMDKDQLQHKLCDLMPVLQRFVNGLQASKHEIDESHPKTTKQKEEQIYFSGYLEEGIRRCRDLVLYFHPFWNIIPIDVDETSEEESDNEESPATQDLMNIGPRKHEERTQHNTVSNGRKQIAGPVSDRIHLEWKPEKSSTSQALVRSTDKQSKQGPRPKHRRHRDREH